MDIKWIVPFLSGLACGIGGTAVTLDRHYSKQFEEEVDILRKNFEDYKKLNPIENSDSNNGERTEYNSSSSESNTGRDEGILSNDERVRIKDNWSIDKQEYIDYASYYASKGTGKIFEEPDLKKDTVSDESQKEITEYSKEIRRSSMPPRILSKREFDMIPKEEYEFICMYYYMYDDKLVIESKELDGIWKVIDADKTIGDCLTKNGFDSNSEEEIHVINYQLKEVYTVKKKWASYSS